MEKGVEKMENIRQKLI